jgi:hypothetical protein
MVVVCSVLSAAAAALELKYLMLTAWPSLGKRGRWTND